MSTAQTRKTPITTNIIAQDLGEENMFARSETFYPVGRESILNRPV